MALVTLVARVVDGLMLCESQRNADRVSQAAKGQASALLRKLHSCPPRCSVETEGPYVFHFSIYESVCVLALFDRVYPKSFAFTFLEEVHCMFREELKLQFGTGAVDYRSYIDSIVKPYSFLSFDRQIMRKADEFRDPSSSLAIQKLHAGLVDVASVLRCNIGEILSCEAPASTKENIAGQRRVQWYTMPCILFALIFLTVLFAWPPKADWICTVAIFGAFFGVLGTLASLTSSLSGQKVTGRNCAGNGGGRAATFSAYPERHSTTLLRRTGPSVTKCPTRQPRLRATHCGGDESPC
jgi:vesicle transport protein SEC22